MEPVRHPDRDVGATTRAVIALAGRQHGRVSTAQLLRLGWSPDVVARRVAAGWLVREHRGVHRLAGATPSLAGRAAGAVLAVDPEAVVSHGTALELHGLLPERPRAPIHLSTSTHHRSRAGVVVHVRPLAPEDTIRLEGMRVTSLTRSLVDAARTEAPEVVSRAVREAEYLRRLDAASLTATCAGRPAAALLRALAEERLPVDGDLVDELERRFARFLHVRGFPPAAVNCRVRLAAPPSVVRLDVVWWEADLALELDGRQAHATARSFDADRERDRRLAVQYGLRVVRVTWAHLERDPDALERDLRTLYAAGVAARRAA